MITGNFAGQIFGLQTGWHKKTAKGPSTHRFTSLFGYFMHTVPYIFATGSPLFVMGAAARSDQAFWQQFKGIFPALHIFSMSETVTNRRI